MWEVIQGSSDLNYVDQVVGIVNRSGVIGILVILIIGIIVGLNRGWFYTGRYVTARDAAWQLRLDEAKTEKESWKMLAMSRRDTTKRAITLAETELLAKGR